MDMRIRPSARVMSPNAHQWPGTSYHNTRQHSGRSKRVEAGPLTPSATYWLRLSIADASLRTMSAKTASVSTSSITPVISNSTNPCIAAQNSSAA